MFKGRKVAPDFITPPVIKDVKHKPKSKFVLVTAAVGEQGEELEEISGPIFRDYAKRHGLDYYVIRGDPGPLPVIQKWNVWSAFNYWERILWLDADIILSPDCPNLLDVVPRGTIGLHDDLPLLANLDWVMSEYRQLALSQRWDPTDLPNVAWNSGVYVADKEHQFAFEVPKYPFPKSWCVEQWHETLLLHRAKTPITRLPPVFNWEWWVDRKPFTSVIPGVFVYHYAGMFKEHLSRVRDMRELKRKLYP
jgi:hypothetical protein